MQVQIQNIVNQNATITKKIEQLILLGLSRTEIVNLGTVTANYGFVQNVYNKMRLQGRLNAVAQLNFEPTIFNRRFGVEIEAHNVDKQTLRNAIVNEGIECYVEGYNHNTRNHWKIVTDGSINGQQTFEVVSPILEGSNGLAQLKKVCKALKRCNAYINKSCGLHIHFDAQGFELKQWKNIFINYANLEPVIDSFMPASRREDNNYYCKGFSFVENFKNKIERLTNLEKLPQIFNNNRYFKINPTSYSRHKTIEFRHHSGTIEFDKINNWIVFLHNLVEFSKENSINENPTFEALKVFNQTEIVAFFEERKTKLAA